MLRLKTHHVLLFLGLMAPLYATAANYCIAVNGGFGGGGTSFVGKGFAVPAAGTCKPWVGFAKTGSTVILNSTGSGCTSSDGKVLTLTIFSTDPAYLGTGGFSSDHIRLCPAGTSGCPIGAGRDTGNYLAAAPHPRLARPSC